MGLEMVSVILRTEDVFGITIVDDDMFYIATVEQYYDYIVQRLKERETFDPHSCMSSVVFYRLRKAFSDNVNVPRSHFTLDKKLDELIPLPHRRENWKALSKTTNFSFPSLDCHFSASLRNGPLKYHIPKGCGTVREFTKTLVRRNADRLSAMQYKWSPEEIWDKLVDIVVNELLVDPKEVTRNARWVDDLGVG